MCTVVKKQLETIYINEVCSSIVNFGTYWLIIGMDYDDGEKFYDAVNKYFKYKLEIPIIKHHESGWCNYSITSCEFTKKSFYILQKFKKNVNLFLNEKYSDEEFNMLCKHLIITLKLTSNSKNKEHCINKKLLKSYSITEDDLVFEKEDNEFCEILNYHCSDKLNYGNFIKQLLDMDGNINDVIKSSSIVFGNLFKFSICKDEDGDEIIKVYTTDIEHEDIKEIYFTLKKDTQKYVYEQFKKMINGLCDETYYLGNINRSSLASIYIELFGGIYDDWKEILEHTDNHEIKDLLQSHLEREFSN